MEGRECAEGVATYVTEDTGRGVFACHLVERGIHVAVSAALAECGRAAYYYVIGFPHGQRLHAQCFAHGVGGQFTHTR